MANAREIQSRMKSIQDTMKITNAMYMISSSKLKKAKKSLADTEPYFYSLQAGIGRILRHFPEIDNIYFDKRLDIKLEDRKIGYIVVTADKGLAGPYNHNIFKMVESCMETKEHNKLFVLGEMGRQYFKKKGVDVSEQFHYTVQNPTIGRARSISERIVSQYCAGELDEVNIIYTKMVSAMQTQTEFIKLLPFEKADYKFPVALNVPREHIVMSPSPNDVVNTIAPNYITGFIYGALVESYSSEHNLRMMAMQAATNSADSMLHELAIEYNRVRQAAITQGITEVVAGAKAQKNKKKKKQVVLN